MTLTQDGERWLNRWLEANALVAWLEDEEPWLLEEKLLGEMSSLSVARLCPSICKTLSECGTDQETTWTDVDRS